MMKRKTNILVLLILLLITLGICVLQATYFKPHVDVAASSPDVSLMSKTLLQDFEQDENAANNKYLEKVIQVAGSISELSATGGNGIVTLAGEGAFGGVTCHLVPGENKKLVNLKVGQNIEIKGICTGYLMDVILVKCVIIK